VPRFNSGDHVFSTTFGKSPVRGFSALKRRLPALDGEWVIHDIRRSVRTNLSALPGITDFRAPRTMTSFWSDRTPVRRDGDFRS
jgi:hypothetical protein